MSGGGWFDDEAIQAERWDADIEQAELVRRGNEIGRSQKRSERLRDAGDLEGAARACPHQGGYPLNSPAAKNNGDPAFGCAGWCRCMDCGSVITCFPWQGEPVVVEACSYLPQVSR